MRARSATFVTSASRPDEYPPAGAPEIAFAGRSNVGKSSLINALVGQRALARTSQTPGRTRLLNWFHVVPPKGDAIAFVDLPGYGYAKVARDLRASWRPMVEAYLTERAVLRGVVCLMDARRGPEAEERELLQWLGEVGIAALPVLTKADKLPKAKRKPAAMAVQRELGLARPPILFSATAGDGLDDLWRGLLKLV